MCACSYQQSFWLGKLTNLTHEFSVDDFDDGFSKTQCHGKLKNGSNASQAGGDCLRYVHTKNLFDRAHLLTLIVSLVRWLLGRKERSPKDLGRVQPLLRWDQEV